MNYRQHWAALNNLRDEAFQVASEWNGDEPGILEERAVVAHNILAKVEELKDLMETFK